MPEVEHADSTERLATLVAHDTVDDELVVEITVADLLWAKEQLIHLGRPLSDRRHRLGQGIVDEDEDDADRSMTGSLISMTFEGISGGEPQDFARRYALILAAGQLVHLSATLGGLAGIEGVFVPWFEDHEH